jgi:hypothetical protein
VSGHDFSRAEKSFIFVIPSGLQAARDLLFRLFQRPLSGVHNAAQLITARFLAPEGMSSVTASAEAGFYHELNRTAEAVLHPIH